MARQAESPITFVLREPSSKHPTPIIGIIWFNNDRLKISTGFKVLPSHWNYSRYRVKNVTDALNKDLINSYLDKLEKIVANVLAHLKSHNIVLTKEKIREEVHSLLNPTVDDNKPKTLIDFVKWYIQTSPTRIAKGTRTGRFISPDTIRRYKTTLNGLVSFSTVYERPLLFEYIDNSFYKAFTSWLIERGHATNNVSKYIENVKCFMNAAIDEGYTTNLAFRKFANMREEADNIYLTEKELQRMYDLDLSNNTPLERVRDLFIFAAWTGLRFSDFSKLQPEHIKSDELGHRYLDLKQHKTGNKIQIPILHEVVQQILTKYNDALPKGISNQHSNTYLKKIAELALINDLILKHITKGGKALIKTETGWAETSAGVEKWTLVSTHTARRSFATNMFKRGMPTYLIMKLTGHKKESEFLKYIKVDQKETMDLIRHYFKS